METRGQINLEQVQAYQRRYGSKQTEEVLRKLGILQTFYNAHSLPLGRELLAEVNSEMIRLSGKILTDPESTVDDKCLYRAFTMIAQSWGKKISTYEETVKNIKES